MTKHKQEDQLDSLGDTSRIETSRVARHREERVSGKGRYQLLTPAEAQPDFRAGAEKRAQREEHLRGKTKRTRQRHAAEASRDDCGEGRGR